MVMVFLEKVKEKVELLEFVVVYMEMEEEEDEGKELEKLWRLMGSWWRKEEEEGGEVVIVVVGMEE